MLCVMQNDDEEGGSQAYMLNNRERSVGTGLLPSCVGLRCVVYLGECRGGGGGGHDLIYGGGSALAGRNVKTRVRAKKEQQEGNNARRNETKFEAHLDGKRVRGERRIVPAALLVHRPLARLSPPIDD
ncbi:hypothetical protein G7K_1164-t1 [Saitoella complicata NRRL Y-17804]|uniref:Uncharacterized protein n=1 Tax=Saitoella complicata (strain BCRC 22490 / CBS 7301 / JCM 7358 / NBRC 10748 / NRRL Y-17804) TaxID=698492 RepID=A0A0E9NAQ2_SAICN|nr:hypothetical protein G7K_1164-t1 [Saitoella complicata NRRL Y-17804]